MPDAHYRFKNIDEPPVTGMIMEKPPVTSRFILGLKEPTDDNRR